MRLPTFFINYFLSRTGVNYDRAVLTNGWWEYVRYHELRDGIDFNDKYLQKVDRLTPADIRDFCRLITTSGNRIQVTMK